MADSNYANDNTSDQNIYGGNNQNANDSYYSSKQNEGSLYNSTSSSTESASFSSNSNSGQVSSSLQYGVASQNEDRYPSAENSNSAYGDSSQGAQNSTSSLGKDSFSVNISDSNTTASDMYNTGNNDSQEKPAENASLGSNLESSSQDLDGKEIKNSLMNIKSEIGKEGKTVFPSESLKMGDALPLAFGAICILFFLLIQNFAQACRRYCQTDSSLSNSVISGASLGYLLLKGLPFLFNLVYAASPQIKNLYLKQHGHLLLVSLMAFGLGFIFNYFFEKKIARNTVEDVAHSKTLYRLNLGVLTVAFFFAGLTVINVIHLHYADIFQYGLFTGLMLCIETATLCYVFTDRSDWIRRGVLSLSVILGFVFGKFFSGVLAPSVFSIGFGFILGFFVFTTIRVELATVKRNSNYSAFIISFMSIAALTLIQSLYESLKC